MNPTEIARQLKARYPQYREMDDVELATKAVANFPSLTNQPNQVFESDFNQPLQSFEESQELADQYLKSNPLNNFSNEDKADFRELLNNEDIEKSKAKNYYDAIYDMDHDDIMLKQRVNFEFGDNTNFEKVNESNAIRGASNDPLKPVLFGEANAYNKTNNPLDASLQGALLFDEDIIAAGTDTVLTNKVSRVYNPNVDISGNIIQKATEPNNRALDKIKGFIAYWQSYFSTGVKTFKTEEGKQLLGKTLIEIPTTGLIEQNVAGIDQAVEVAEEIAMKAGLSTKDARRLSNAILGGMSYQPTSYGTMFMNPTGQEPVRATVKDIKLARADLNKAGQKLIEEASEITTALEEKMGIPDDIDIEALQRKALAGQATIEEQRILGAAYGYKVALELPKVAAQVGITIGVTLATKNPLAGARAGGMFMGIQAVGSSQAAMKEEGWEGLISPLIDGGAEYVGEKFGLQSLMSPFVKKRVLKGFKDYILSVGLSTTGEASSEALTQILQNGNAMFWDTLAGRERGGLFGGVQEAATLGGLIGGGISGTSQLFAIKRDKVVKNPTKKNIDSANETNREISQRIQDNVSNRIVFGESNGYFIAVEFDENGAEVQRLEVENENKLSEFKFKRQLIAFKAENDKDLFSFEQLDSGDLTLNYQIFEAGDLISYPIPTQPVRDGTDRQRRGKIAYSEVYDASGTPDPDNHERGSKRIGTNLKEGLKILKKSNRSKKTDKKAAAMWDILDRLAEKFPSLFEESYLAIAPKIAGAAAYYQPRSRTVVVQPSDSSVQTLLHETIHAITLPIMKKELADLGSKYPELETFLYINYSKPTDIIKTYQAIAEKAPNTTMGQLAKLIMTTIEEQGIETYLANRKISGYGFYGSGSPRLGTQVPYGLAQMVEFVTEAMSNPTFQRELESIKMPASDKTSVWSEFTKWVKQILGFLDLKKNQNTVLNETIGLIDEMGGLSDAYLKNVREVSQQQEQDKTKLPNTADGEMTFYQGRGAKAEDIYEGAQTPALGGGQYYARTEQDAKDFGDDVTSRSIPLNTILEIRSPEQFSQLLQEVFDKFPELGANDPKYKQLSNIAVYQDLISSSPDAAARLRDVVMQKGYDGMNMLNVNNESLAGSKAYRNLLSIDQLVLFREPAQRTTKKTVTELYEQEGVDVSFKERTKRLQEATDLRALRDAYENQSIDEIRNRVDELYPEERDRDIVLNRAYRSGDKYYLVAAILKAELGEVAGRNEKVNYRDLAPIFETKDIQQIILQEKGNEQLLDLSAGGFKGKALFDGETYTLLPETVTSIRQAKKLLQNPITNNIKKSEDLALLFNEKIKQEYEAEFEEARTASFEADLTPPPNPNAEFNEKVWQIATQVKETIFKVLPPSLTTRIRALSPQVYRRLMAMHQQERLLFISYKKIFRPFKLSVNQIMRQLGYNDSKEFKAAILNGEYDVVRKYFKKFNLDTAPITAVQEMFADMAGQLGIKQNPKYFRRVVVDYKGLVEYLGKNPTAEIEKALKKEQDRLKGRKLTKKRIEKVIRSFLTQDRFGDGVLQFRSINEVTPELSDFYANPVLALDSYFSRISRIISRKDMFGIKPKKIVDPDFEIEGIEDDANELNKSVVEQLLTELLGSKTVSELADFDKLTDLLKSALSYRPSKVHSQMLRNLASVKFVNQIDTYMLQIADIPIGMLYNGIMATLKSFAGSQKYMNSAMEEMKIGLADIGIEVFDVEFQEGLKGKLQAGTDFYTKLQKLLSNMMLPLQGFDFFGKNQLLKATQFKWADMAKNNPKALRRMLINKFVDPEFVDRVIKDIKANKATPDAKLAFFMHMAEFHPITTSDHIKWYIDHPQYRIFFVLQSFAWKMVDRLARQGTELMVDGMAEAIITVRKNAGKPITTLRDQEFRNSIRKMVSGVAGTIRVAILTQIIEQAIRKGVKLVYEGMGVKLRPQDEEEEKKQSVMYNVRLGILSMNPLFSAYDVDKQLSNGLDFSKAILSYINIPDVFGINTVESIAKQLSDEKLDSAWDGTWTKDIPYVGDMVYGKFEKDRYFREKALLENTQGELLLKEDARDTIEGLDDVFRNTDEFFMDRINQEQGLF